MLEQRKGHDYYPELVPNEVAVQVVDNIGMLILSHDKDLIDDELFLGLLF